MYKIKWMIVIVCLFTLSDAMANAIFSITPSVTTIYIRSDSSTIIPYEVVNNSSSHVQNITINPGANLSIVSNNCNQLAPKGSCQFRILISGQNQPAVFVVSPIVCAFNQTACSQPIASERLGVFVAQVDHPTRAFVGMSTNTVVPITLVPGTAGIAGTSIYGFLFNEPSGIALNLAGTLAYVSNSGTNSLFVIDTNSSSILSQYDVGNLPDAVAVSPDGTKLYVSNFNNGQYAGTVSVLAANTGTLLGTIAVGNGPWGLALSPDGSFLYVSNSYDNTVSVVNALTFSVVSTLSVGQTPFGIAASPDGTKVYVVNSNDNSVSVIDAKTKRVIQDILVGNIPKGIAISPDGKAVYVANWQDGTISIIDTSSEEVVQTLTVPGSTPLGLAISPDGTQLYITSDATSAVAVVQLNTNAVSYVITAAPQLTMGNFIG